MAIWGRLPWKAVPAYVAAAYWFTASTSFANPAVTIARALTDSFTGVASTDAAGFIAARIAGAALATLICPWLVGNRPVQLPAMSRK